MLESFLTPLLPLPKYEWRKDDVTTGTVRYCDHESAAVASGSDSWVNLLAVLLLRWCSQALHRTAPCVPLVYCSATHIPRRDGVP